MTPELRAALAVTARSLRHPEAGRTVAKEMLALLGRRDGYGASRMKSMQPSATPSRRHLAPGSVRVRRPASPAMITWLRHRWFEVASLGAGLLILAGTLRVTGIHQLARDLSTIGWGLAVVVLIEGLSVVFNTAGWALAFPHGERRVGAGRLLGLRLAGDGVNYLTPSATVGGELLRIRLLAGLGTVERDLGFRRCREAWPDRRTGGLRLPRSRARAAAVHRPVALDR